MSFENSNHQEPEKEELQQGGGERGWEEGYEFRVDENDVRDDGGFDDVSMRKELCSFDREQLDSVSVLCALSKSWVWRDFSSTLSPRLELEGSQLSEL